jgi:hypothetical protein
MANADWLDEFRVNSVSYGKQASRGADTPWSLVCGSDGRVHMVWEDRREGDNLRIYYRGKSQSGGWNNWDAGDMDISPIDSTAYMGHPSIGALDDGTLLAVFAEEKDAGGELLGAVFDTEDSSWNQPEYVSLPGGNCLSFSSIGWQTTIATNGNRAVTFWPYVGDSLGTNRPAYFRRYQDGMWEEGERPLLLPEIGLAYSAKNLSAAWGRGDTVYFVFAAITEGESVYNIYFLKLNYADGQVTYFETLTNDSVYNQEYPYICRNSSAQFGEGIYVVFNSKENGNTAKMIYWREYTGNWSSPIQISDEPVTTGYPCIAANLTGTIEIAYEQPANEPTSQIYYRPFYPGADTFGIASRVSTGEQFSKRPVIACDIFGNIHVAYISNRLNPDEPGDEEVYYRMFDSPPSPPQNIVNNGDTIRWDYPALPDLRGFMIFHVDNEDTVLIGGTTNRYFRHGFGPEANFGVRAFDSSYAFSPMAILTSQSGIEISTEQVSYQLPSRNYPNPFNGAVTIKLSRTVSGAGGFIDIFNLTGQLVNRLEIKQGNNSVIWDGKDRDGRVAVSGIYFYRAYDGTRDIGAGQMTMIK